MDYDKYTTAPVKTKEADKIEQVLRDNDIPFSVENRFGKPPIYITYSTPEHALRNAGFLVWGTRFNLICRIRKVLRKKEK